MIFIKQHDSTDCGPACIAMVASFFHKFCTVGSLRELSKTDLYGTSIKGMVDAANAIGLEAIPVIGKPEDIKPSLEVPFIAHVSKQLSGHEFKHYVVVKKIYKKRILIYDPSVGKKFISYEKFLQHWTKYVLVIRNKDSSIIKQNHFVLLSFFPLIKPHIHDLVVTFLASLLLSFFGIISSLYFKYLIDDVLIAKSLNTLNTISIGILIITFLQVSITLIRTLLLLKISVKIDNRLILSYIKHILNLPISFFESRKTGEILSRIDDIQKIRVILSDTIISIILDSLMVVFVGIFLLIQAPSFLLIILITILITSSISFLFSSFFSKKYKQFMEEKSDLNSFLVELVSGIHTIKSLNAIKEIFNNFERKQIKLASTGFSVEKKRELFKFFNSLLLFWTNNIIFWVGSSLILKDILTLGELIAYSSLLSLVITPLQSLIFIQPLIQESKVAAERIKEVFDIKTETNNDYTYIENEKLSGNIIAKNISFRYGNRKLILHNINFQIYEGQCVAFVGASGCGKSTLIKLLLKFYAPLEGDILFDECNLQDISPTWLRKRISYVPQDIYLFADTISNNISLGKKDITLKEIVRVSQKTKANAFIEELPNRYNTEVSERGNSFSGGEKQRIAIARALLSDSDIYIFDEPTSNLDVVTELKINDIIKELHDRKKTIIIITHKLSTLINCDKIFVMEKGKIIENGTHLELLENNGLYKKMWDANSL